LDKIQEITDLDPKLVFNKYAKLVLEELRTKLADLFNQFFQKLVTPKQFRINEWFCGMFVGTLPACSFGLIGSKKTSTTPSSFRNNIQQKYIQIVEWFL
jgi:hypothetical protein